MEYAQQPSSFGFYSVQQPPAVVRPPPTVGERYRAILMSVFLNHESHKLPELLTNPTPPADLDVDLIIDDQGHSSLHWAAALSRIPVLQHLLNLGADPRRVNYNGESALIRAVLVTNNFDNDTFPDLLNLLHGAIDITDKKGRTIIHHIALTAGIKGRMQASRYYLDSLLDMMTKTAMDVGAIIDVQDKNGDTALNIAARIANRNLVEQLLKAGADAEIPNRAGLRPIDFGLEDERLMSLFEKVGGDGVCVAFTKVIDFPHTSLPTNSHHLARLLASRPTRPISLRSVWVLVARPRLHPRFRLMTQVPSLSILRRTRWRRKHSFRRPLPRFEISATTWSSRAKPFTTCRNGLQTSRP